MAKKRGQGEGSISKREDGTWWARITVGTDADGKQKRKAFYGKTRAEVQKKMTTAVNEMNNGAFIPTSNVTLEQWLKTWFDEYAANSIKHSTKVSYDDYIHKHIIPNIGRMKLIDIRPDTLQKFYNDKLENGRLDGKGGLSPKTIKNIHNMLHKSLQQAVDNNLIYRNPSNSTTTPKITKKEMRVLSPAEHMKVLESSHNDKHGLIIRLGLATGMRLGELVASQWRDVDFTSASLYVRRNLGRLKNYDDEIEAKTVIVIAEPKTKTSKRTIPLSDEILADLKSAKAIQDDLKKQCGEGYNDEGFIFASPMGTCIEPRTMQDAFKRVLGGAGVQDANFHALRHTFATRALEAGIPAKVVSEILGHASVGITLDLYSHVSLDTKRDAINKISAYVAAQR